MPELVRCQPIRFSSMKQMGCQVLLEYRTGRVAGDHASRVAK